LRTREEVARAEFLVEALERRFLSVLPHRFDLLEQGAAALGSLQASEALRRFQLLAVPDDVGRMEPLRSDAAKHAFHLLRVDLVVPEEVLHWYEYVLSGVEKVMRHSQRHVQFGSTATLRVQLERVLNRNQLVLLSVDEQSRAANFAYHLFIYEPLPDEKGRQRPQKTFHCVLQRRIWR
jgi:hypothetical protein